MFKYLVAFALISLSCGSIKGLCQDGFIEGTPALAYYKVGKGEQTIIILHGGPAAGHSYLRPEWDALSKVGQVVYYDQRGAGKSELSSCYSWQAHVEDLKRVITKFSAKGKVILAGSSWGTQLALLYAYTYPNDVKGIILSGTVKWFGMGDASKECSAYIPGSDVYKKVDTSFVYVSLKDRSMFKKPATMDSATLQKLSKGKYFEAPFTPRVATSFSLKEAPIIASLKNIQVPVLLVEGKGNCIETQYHKDGAQSYAQVLRNVQLSTIEDACHDPWYTHSLIFFSKCIDFIKGIR
ncbi:MAG TPA: alpha/beta hydrolase [Segetibacter sp.]|jgi:pimeloyl-ACP methyl ester carboxylesterase